jgi:HEPN domain-containing protein
MTNYQKARDWMHLASLELRTALATFQGDDFSACVQHCQQSLERAIKSLFAFLGKEVKRTHAPSLELRRGILEDPEELQRLGLSPDHIELLVDIVTRGSSLEGQGTMPRYGWETAERIIPPDEIYDRELVSLLVGHFLDVMSAVCLFHRLSRVEEIMEVVTDVEAGIAEFRELGSRLPE